MHNMTTTLYKNYVKKIISIYIISDALNVTCTWK